MLIRAELLQLVCEQGGFNPSVSAIEQQEMGDVIGLDLKRELSLDWNE